MDQEKRRSSKSFAAFWRRQKGHPRRDGSIAPLIELGAGFDPLLSLVDNIVYYGLLLGIERRRMREHVDSILDFAELREYRDEPVKTLSSGMTARLGFAIATEFRPDILILDEVLAVGDESFARKCRERIDQLMGRARNDSRRLAQSGIHLAGSAIAQLWLEKGAMLLDAQSARSRSCLQIEG